jgi:hypothetical protein
MASWWCGQSLLARAGWPWRSGEVCSRRMYGFNIVGIGESLRVWNYLRWRIVVLMMFEAGAASQEARFGRSNDPSTTNFDQTLSLSLSTNAPNR